VVVVLGRLVDVDLHPLHLSGELIVLRPIVVADWRRAVGADIGRLVGRKDHRLGGFKAALAGLFPSTNRVTSPPFARPPPS
jgi:hypothetical protein